jgi:muramidase (phage lysozyme)
LSTPRRWGWQGSSCSQQGHIASPIDHLTSPLITRLTVLGLSAVLPIPMAATAVSRPSFELRLPEPVPAVSVRQAEPGPYSLTPERRALLDTIRYAEGTWTGGRPDGYRMLYGGTLVQALDRHPEIVVRRRYTSAAAGAYQFLPDTWAAVARQLGLTSFQPHHQDQAALHLIQRRGALNLFDRQGLTADVLAKLAPEWASLPAHHGGSYYGQPVKQRQDLLSFFQAALTRHREATAS